VVPLEALGAAVVSKNHGSTCGQLAQLGTKLAQGKPPARVKTAKNTGINGIALFKLDYSEQFFPNQTSAKLLLKGI
jgi:hypothetical protein